MMSKVLCALFFLLTGSLGWAASTNERMAPPKLVVVVSLDQFRADYLERFRPFFGPGGFELFLQHGAVFTDCHYRHSHTKTAPGHSVMLTGVHANRHGIIGNEWLDRVTFTPTSCVGDETAAIVGLPPRAGPRISGLSDPYLGRSPNNLLVTTVGDEWKRNRGFRPKVIGISSKDRAAILMSGKLADAAYFTELGRFVSSTYYMKELPAWVTAWNASGKVDAYFGKVWDRVLPAAAYDAQGPDAGPGEGAGTALGTTFPKTVTGGDTQPGPKFYSALDVTPFDSELLADFAKAAVRGENLGRRGETDIMCVSFSATDMIGHIYGPDSHEVMDNAIRTDRILADFFTFLDQWVGLANVTLILTSDHGVAPTPEFIRLGQRADLGGRVSSGEVIRICEKALTERFGAVTGPSGWMVLDDVSILIQPAALKEKSLTRAEVETTLQAALLTLPYVQAAYTRTQLEAQAVQDELGRRALLSFNVARSGDVFFQYKPYYFSTRYPVGSTHGSPYNYDTHVPLLWHGVGVKPGIYTERVGVDDLAPTLSHVLGIVAPPFSEGHVLF